MSLDSDTFVIKLEKVTNILNQLGIYDTQSAEDLLTNFLQDKYNSLDVIEKRNFLPILLNIKLPIIIHNFRRNFKSRVFLLGPTIPQLIIERYKYINSKRHPLMFWSLWNKSKKRRKFTIGPLFPFKPFRKIFNIRAYNDRVFNLKVYDILKINLIHSLFLDMDFSFLKFKREFNFIYRVLFTFIYRDIFKFRKIDFKRGMRGFKK